MIHFIFLEFLEMSPVIRKTFVPSSADICIQAATFYSMPVVFTTQAQVCLVNTYIHTYGHLHMGGATKDFYLWRRS